MSDKTRFTGLEVTGGLEVADGIEAPYFKGSVRGAVQKSLSANATISEDAIYYGLTLSAASKTVTLDRAEGTVCFVMNEGGTNAFTLKNVSGDTGTSIAAGKIALVVASRTANKTVVTVLN